MPPTPPIKAIVQANPSPSSWGTVGHNESEGIQTGKKLGMQLLDEHLWRLYDAGTIALEEMLDKGRQPGALQDKATAKIEASRGKHKHKKKAAQKEMEDMGQILRS